MYKITVPIMVTTGRPIEKEKILEEIKRFGGERIALVMARKQALVTVITLIVFLL